MPALVVCLLSLVRENTGTSRRLLNIQREKTTLSHPCAAMWRHSPQKKKEKERKNTLDVTILLSNEKKSPDVWLVDAHSVGDGGADDAHFPPLPRPLHALPFRHALARVVVVGGNVLLPEKVAQRRGFLR